MSYPVVCFGEILWDILPDSVVPGGAPMNVAYHLKKLGVDPALITRVGLDNSGKRLIQLMERQQISTEFFQIDFELDTGKVTMTPGEGEDIHYDIVKPVAWDNIQWDDQFGPLLRECSWFVFGSLSARTVTNRDLLFRLQDLAKHRVLDINLRIPHYNRCTLERLLSGTELLKLNHNELELLTGWFSGYRSERDRIKALQDRFNIPTIVVTKGSQGSVMTTEGEFYDHPGFRVDLADTVGSGDAFLAGLLFQLSMGAPPGIAIEFASAMGALIASYSGPCPEYQVEEIQKLIAH